MRGITWIRLDAIKDTGVKPEKELTESMRTYGLLQNVVVKPTPKGYEVVAGRRRVEAAKKMGIKGIPAIVINATEEELAQITLTENMQRSTNPGAEAKAIKTLMSKGYTQKEIAKLMGVSRSQVAKRALLLRLTPRLFKKLEEGKLRPSVARELAQLSQEEQRRYEEQDKITLQEVREYRKRKTLEELKKVDVDRIEPEPIPKTLLERAGLTESEIKILKHAYQIGLFEEGRPTIGEAAKNYGMRRQIYHKHLLRARRKILTQVCREVFR